MNAYRSREAYRDGKGNPNWAEWASKNPTEAETLVRAEEAIHDS